MDNQTDAARDTTHDILRYQRQSLEAIFQPTSIAVIGATERPGSVGRAVMANLLSSGFEGSIFPINFHRKSVLEVKTYPHVAAVPASIDLAIFATPAESAPALVGECAAAGVRAAIILAAGFRERGAAGSELEQQVLEQAGGRLRILGPNSFGVMQPHFKLNATFARAMALPGHVAFISQSGALGAAILDWSLQENVGFSAFISVGSMLDIGWGDLIDYLGDDPRTKSIILYMETIGDARSFLSAAREVALTKPIIVLKAGHTAAAARAAASHTGSLTGNDRVLEAAFWRCGVLRVNTIAELFYMAEVLDKQPRPRGSRLTILTNAGGPGVLAADALLASGGRLAPLSPETSDQLDQLLPAHWSHNNPIDILSDADAQRYAQALKLAAQDANSDGLLVILTPQATADPTATATMIQTSVANFGAPILASWMGGAQVAEGKAILNRAGIPVFPFPDTAARMFAYMWHYTESLRGLYETPILPPDSDNSAMLHQQVVEIIHAARQTGRTLLNEVESKNILAAYGLPVVATHAAENEEAAVALADRLGYPVVLKMLSNTVTHKTASGGVRLSLHEAAAVRQAFREIAAVQQAEGRAFEGVTVQPMIPPPGIELILGSTVDPQFGPVLLFGAGGLLAETVQDFSLALPPLTTTLARRMMERTRIFQALQQAAQQQALHLEVLTQMLVRLSWLVVEHPEIKEIEVNPLFVSSARILALDARVLLHEASLRAEELPKPAIRPYPRQYQSPWQLKNGTPVLIRPIRPEDEPLMVTFHQKLSERTVYLRYFHLITLTQRIAHERLTRICFIDYDREMALVVERRSEDGEGREIIGVGRLSRSRCASEAEFAVVVSDEYQGQGLGTELLRRLLQIAAAEKFRRVSADILPDNDDMQRVCKKLGMQVRFDHEEHVIKTWIDLPAEK